MTLLIWLRLAADLSFYYAFAAFFVSLSGTAVSLPGIFIPSFFCALSRLAGDRRMLRCSIVLPAVLTILLPVLGMWDRIALIPAITYSFYLAWCGNYNLSHERQSDMFLLFGKSYPIFFLYAALFGGLRLLIAGSLLPALIMVILSVYLLRVLRHEPEIYTKPRFLLTNMWTLVVFVLAAWLMHLDAVTHAITSALLFVFHNIITPILSAALYAIAYIISFLLTPLMQFFNGNADFSLNTETGVEGLADQNLSENAGAQYPLLARILSVAAVLAAAALVCVILIRLFRRLAGDRTSSIESEIPTQRLDRSAAPSDEKFQRQFHVSPLHPVNQVRRQYRRYLKLCRGRGYTPCDFYTSREICRQTGDLFDDTACIDELRALYIRARYRGDASREDSVRAAQLVDQLRSSR